MLDWHITLPVFFVKCYRIQTPRGLRKTSKVLQ